MPDPTIALTAFLSHKYKAPVVNEYFFQLLSDRAHVEFEVDVGSAPTNVTRLERLIRDADGFIGIYPFDESGPANPAPSDLVNAAKYFRLELDIAARARKPGLIFCDSRFRGIISAPAPMTQVGFDIQEIAGRGSRPNSARFSRAVESFGAMVAASRACALAEERYEAQGNRVGVLLPPDNSGSGYSGEQVRCVLEAVRSARYEPVELAWPPLVTPEWTARVREFDWIVIDVGPAAAATGVVGYLHGDFKPCMRLMRVPNGASAAPGEIDLALYAGFTVGYSKDIVRWTDTGDLQEGVVRRMAALTAERKRISTLEEALKYFAGAALRKEAVFVSYCGADLEAASPLIQALSRKFQKVFDYRDGQSIRTGQPWMKEIFEQLAVSPIGIPLLSSSYIDSENCMHELREMVARRDGKVMQIFPIRLSRADKFDMPAFLQDTQYTYPSNFESPDKLAESIVSAVGDGRFSAAP